MLDQLGFTKEEIKNLKKPNEFADTEYNFSHQEVKDLKLKKKDIIHLINLGFTKENIEHITLEDWLHFKNKDAELVTVNTSYALRNEETGDFIPTTKEVFEQQKAKKENTGEVSTLALCDPNVGCTAHNSGSSIKLTVTVVRSGTIYAINSSFEWSSNPANLYRDLLSSGYHDYLTMDFSSIYGNYETDYYDLNTNTLKHTTNTALGGKNASSTTGYTQYIDLHSNSYQLSTGQWVTSKYHGGYTYGEFYWSSGTSASAFTYYTHVKTSWNTSWTLSYPWSVGVTIDQTTQDQVIPDASVSFTK
ncbi:hypothetical protein ACFVRR_17300 [Gottfriedia sp. NPDC057948]|uniref:hypothetical protein n=1 Tax=Gottfriedia sp. NPDC057948 TaxID=3346287 RepID=UPI0036D7FFCC